MVLPVAAIALKAAPVVIAALGAMKKNKKKFKCKKCGFEWSYKATTENKCPRCGK